MNLAPLWLLLFDIRSNFNFMFSELLNGISFPYFNFDFRLSPSHDLERQNTHPAACSHFLADLPLIASCFRFKSLVSRVFGAFTMFAADIFIALYHSRFGKCASKVPALLIAAFFFVHLLVFPFRSPITPLSSTPFT
jgi:hypothetical protein